MAAPTEVYVDPAINANSGSGTIGSPYGDLQFALNTVTRDSTNGNRFNIKAGTAEVLTGQLSLATYGTPTADAPLLMEGYTSAAGDGGIGDINGNAGNFTLIPNNNFQIYRNVKLRNSGTAVLVPAGLNWLTFDLVEFNTCTNASAITAGAGTRFLNCNFNTFTTAGQNVLTVTTGQGVVITGCWFDVNGVQAALNIATADSGLFTRNIFNVAGATIAIRINNVRGCVFSHNSILANAGTGSGIALVSSGADGAHVVSNVISGFSGTGGEAVDIASGSRLGIYGYNYFHNNTANETGVSGNVLNSVGDNEAGASDPFAKSGANTFANRFVYFSPVATGNIRGGAYPGSTRLDKGAVQHADPAAGGTQVAYPFVG